MQLLLKSCALRSSEIVNVSRMAKELKARRQLIIEYLLILENLFLVDRIPAWVPETSDRLGKTPKVFVCDTGLMCALAGVEDAKALLDEAYTAQREFLANLFETWVYQQLAPLVDVLDSWKIFHFRHRDNRAIDFLLENRHTAELIGIKVKASEGVGSSDFKHLRWFKDNYCQRRKFTGVVLYAGNEVFAYQDGEYALPIAYLWR